MSREPTELDDDDEETADPTSEAQLSVDQESICERATSLAGAGQVLEFIAVVATILTILGGFVVIGRSSKEIGVTLILGGAFTGLFYWALARALRLFADHVSFQARSAYRMVDVHYNGRSARTAECPDCREDVWEGTRVCPYCSHKFRAS